jgi:hypothetical protein
MTILVPRLRSLGSRHEDDAMRAGPRFGADLGSLDETALRLTAAARAVDDLRDHPGVLRGRALDLADDELATAVVDLAIAWDWGLQGLAAETRRWAALVTCAADAYRQADARATQADRATQTR